MNVQQRFRTYGNSSGGRTPVACIFEIVRQRSCGGLAVIKGVFATPTFGDLVPQCILRMPVWNFIYCAVVTQFWFVSIFFYFQLLQCLQSIGCEAMFKRKPNFLPSEPSGRGSALWLLSARDGCCAQLTAICRISLRPLVGELRPLKWERAQAVRSICIKVTMKELEGQRVWREFCYKFRKTLTCILIA